LFRSQALSLACFSAAMEAPIGEQRARDSCTLLPLAVACTGSAGPGRGRLTGVFRPYVMIIIFRPFVMIIIVIGALAPNQTVTLLGTFVHLDFLRWGNQVF
jgi:hypothetical protein